MTRQAFDRGARWVLAHHGEAVLHLAGIMNVAQCKPVQSELLQPRQLPDGILEVRLTDREGAHYVVVEVSTYPDRRSVEQARTNSLMVLLERGVLPEMVVIVLSPKGTYEPEASEVLASALGLTRLETSWRVIKLWEVPAESMLEADVGVIPLVPLMKASAPPAEVLGRCRERIDRDAREDERANLLAVTWVLARLRYNEEDLKAMFGGRSAVIESPFFQDLQEDLEFLLRSKTLKEKLADAQFVSQFDGGKAVATQANLRSKRESIVRFLTARFGPLPPDVSPAVDDEPLLDELIDLAATCPDLAAFRARLAG
jgi:predicted transposase YdaD